MSLEKNIYKLRHLKFSVNVLTDLYKLGEERIEYTPNNKIVHLRVRPLKFEFTEEARASFIKLQDKYEDLNQEHEDDMDDFITGKILTLNLDPWLGERN